jgi:hypothetical protein
MEFATKKLVNRVKDAIKTQEGPVKKDQSTAPVADAIRAYWENDMLTFSIPAHNGGRGPAPEFTSGRAHGQRGPICP